MRHGGRVIRVFPHKTWVPSDGLAFIGDPPLVRPGEDLPVRISCTFTWDKKRALQLLRSWSEYYSDVKVGGPAFDDHGGEFEPGMFVREGVTFTSRGCPLSCPWCFVPAREGDIRELEIKPGFNISDNNFLACSKAHIRKVFDMLRHVGKPAEFAGGLDARLLRPWHVDLLRGLKVGFMFFACDYPDAISNLSRIAPMLRDFPMRKKRCYVLVGFNGEPIQDAEARLREVGRLGFFPMAMLYRPMDARSRYNGSRAWQEFVSLWARPRFVKYLIEGKRLPEMSSKGLLF